MGHGTKTIAQNQTTFFSEQALLHQLLEYILAMRRKCELDYEKMPLSPLLRKKRKLHFERPMKRKSGLEIF